MDGDNTDTNVVLEMVVVVLMTECDACSVIVDVIDVVDVTVVLAFVFLVSSFLLREKIP